MKTGKISESILKRSVLRLIKTHREEVIKGAEVGGDCAFLSWKENSGDRVILSTQTMTLPIQKSTKLAVMAAANNLAAAGGEAIAVMLSLTLPEGSTEEDLKKIMDQAEDCCARLHIQIAGGHTEVSAAVRTPVITVTAMGAVRQEIDGQKVVPPDLVQQGKEPDVSRMDLVVSKWIGLEGTVILACEKEEELLRRYPPHLINKAKSCEEQLSVASEAAIALKSGVYAMHDVRNGGIFGALWELSRKIGVGLSVFLKDIPLRQETVEICEFYDLNPYELLSGGCLLMVTENGGRLCGALREAGIPASVIGRTNGSNDKVVKNGDEIRYLTMPAQDEIWKVSFPEMKEEQ